MCSILARFAPPGVIHWPRLADSIVCMGRFICLGRLHRIVTLQSIAKIFCLLLVLATSGSCRLARAQESTDIGRTGYLVRVPLPIVGNRDAEVIQQIRRIAQATTEGTVQRPVVVLRFETVANSQQVPQPGTQSSRGSQFERCLALARYLTDREAASIRIVAYLPSTVEGHAVLPVLACQEVFAAPGIELGRAAADLASDPTVLAAYQDIVSRGRTNIPAAVVEAMLTPNTELRRVTEFDSGGIRVVTQHELMRLREEGRLSEEHETIWNGLGLAAFSAEQMRVWLWISPTVQNQMELAATLEVEGSLRNVQQLPREWKAATITIRDSLPRQRVNQIIRSIQDAVEQEKINLLVILVEAANCEFDDASRLASAVVDLREKAYTIGLVQSSLTGPVGLVPAVCNECVLIGDATLGPEPSSIDSTSLSAAQQRVLDHLASVSERPLPLLSVLVDRNAVVNVYTHQSSGRREVFLESQVQLQMDHDVWIAKTRLAGGEPIPSDLAIQYGLVSGVEESTLKGLSRLGLSEQPKELAAPWLDSSIQRLVGQAWVPRLLLMIGMMALMIELGNPGISLGGLVAGLCFLGYFWIEGLNGNVEWLEILLFFGGIFALSIEVLILPGFGIFGVTGLMMVFVSLVLAGQTFVWPNNSSELGQVAANLFWVAFIAFSAMIGLLFMHKKLESLPMFRWLSLQPAGTDELEELDRRETVVNFDYLLGQQGLTTTRLNPSGKAQFGSEIVSVVGSGGLIDPGVPVVVVEVRGNLVIVEETA